MKICNMKIEYLGATDEVSLKNALMGVSIASRISRNPRKAGDLLEFVQNKTYEENVRFIRRVFGYGHTSITEIQYVAFVMQDISVILEHFLIGKRMTAFSIKSRRECNFKEEGCYLPTFHNKSGKVHESNEELQELFLKNEENLFSTYEFFTKNDIPYEDARNILPYSFPSNLVMACTVHEFCIIINELLYGNISQLEEARILGEKLKNILLTIAPYANVNISNDKEIIGKLHNFITHSSCFSEEEYRELLFILQELSSLLLKVKENPSSYSYKEFEGFIKQIEDFIRKGKQDASLEKTLEMKEFQSIISEIESYLLITISERVKLRSDSLSFLDTYNIKELYPKKLETQILNYTRNGDEVAIISLLMNRYHISYESAKDSLERLKLEDEDIERKIIKGIMNTPHCRALEQVYYQFSYWCSLALTTHFQRQRLHSLMSLEFVPIKDLNHYYIPETICCEKDFERKFHEAQRKNIELFKSFQQLDVDESDLVYFYISGNMFRFVTSMNARYLIHLSRLRTCRKAQKMTYDIVASMCEEAKKVTPIIGECFGPSCQVLGYCKEGNDNCQKRRLQKIL